jgi:recombination protein RecA
MEFKELVKTYGDVIHDGKSIVENDRQIIPLSPALDSILGGGILEGSFFILTGQPKVGKTVSALSFAATCQKKEYGDREIFYANIEGRLKRRDLEGIEGLNLTKFHIFGSTLGNILTADKYLSIGERLIHEYPGSVIIFDSFSALVTETELTAGMDEMQRADGPKVIAKFCRKVGNIVPVNRNIIIGITHLMGNPSGYGKAFKEKSGQALSYQTDTKIWANKASKLMIGDQSVGLEVEWEVITSSIGPPGVKTNSVIRFGTGIDKYVELVRIGVDLGFINKKGSWYNFDGIDELKVQGEEQARKVLIENPEFYDQIYQRFREYFV